jgi:ribonuclease R
VRDRVAGRGARLMARPDWRYYRARQRERGRRRRRSAPKTAREGIEALLREELEWRGFRAALEVEAGEAAAAAEARELPRRDLVELPTFTVDPATARDFDDAVSARREGDSVRLWVHIADVAAHVPPGSPLDREARRRGNSTYAPGTVEPMLPHALSEEACSLAPGVERLAVTAEIELGPDGSPASARFYRSRIRSDARLDYDQLDIVFSGRAEAPAAVAEPLAVAREAAALGERRGSTSLDVESFEPEFRFDAAGDAIGARGVAQTESHRLIERLMILANEQVAQLLERKRVPAIYRVHARPDPPRIERLIEQLHELEVPTPPLSEGLAPGRAAEAAAEASRLVVREAARRGHGRDAYTTLVLRSLKQAQYSELNSGHAGLGSAAYCHFTSPIRRYPDLVVHRALLAALGEGETAPSAAEAREAASHCSERERESMRIERSADDVCAAFLLERELGERGRETAFEGEVSGLIRAGAFVGFGGELGDVYEGFLPARRLGGAERFELNATETALVGAESKRRLRLGDPISVQVSGVEAARGRVDLEPVEG